MTPHAIYFLQYPNMLCVEAGAVTDAVKLSGGATWIASQVITLE